MTVICDCCEPVAPLTPLALENRPGLSAIAYRIGTYASFRQAMLTEIARTPEMARLTTRQSDDYSITLMELWAVVCDVLTFYQERYANEAYLRTARQRESVGRLARLVDYTLRPGAAALAYLAFTVDKSQALQIPVGLRVQSVPGPQKDASPPTPPQTYETLEMLNADARFNSLRIYPVPSTAVGPLAQNQIEAILDRTNAPQFGASLAPHDRVVIFDANALEEKEIAATRIADDRVVLAWTQPIQRAGGWSPTATAYKFKRTFRLFGINAPSSYVTSSKNPKLLGGVQWTFNSLDDYSYPQSPTTNTQLDLDARYEGLEVGGKLLFADSAGGKKLVTIIGITQVNATLGGMSDTVTRITLAAADAISAVTDRRTVFIYELTGESIAFWDSRYAASVTGDTVYISGWKVTDANKGDGVEVGRTISRDHFESGFVIYLNEIEIGRRVVLSDANNQPVLATIKAAPVIYPVNASVGSFSHLGLTLSAESALSLGTDSAVLLGNVALASHGETVRSETIGNGDGAKKFQTFQFQKKLLTFIPDANPTGVKSTLQLLVNKVRWKEVPELYGQAANAQVYKTRLADNGTLALQFGDGTMGAIPPTGRANIIGTYRQGLGLVGRVNADQLTTLMDRPTGLTGVTNPLPSDGGADPETMENARQNAPLSVRTFGRAVSLRDFEDLVLASGQAAKAQATWVWDGYDRSIFLTVAQQGGQPFTTEGLKRLGDSLDSARDPNHRLQLANYVQVPLLFQADLRVDENYVQKDVLSAAIAALTNALSFDTLRLAQPIHLSDLYAVLQGVEGIVSVDINTLKFKKPTGMTNSQYQAYLDARGVTRLSNGDPDPLQGHLRIFPALPDPTTPGKVAPAELGWAQAPTQDLILNATGGLTK